MPLFANIKVDNYTQIIVWDVKETNEELLVVLNLSEKRIQKFNNLSEKRKREFLGIRICLQYLGKDLDVEYDANGKPFLNSNHQLSITHSHGKVAVGVSRYKIGIDIELRRDEKIQNIKRKFIRQDEHFIHENELDTATFLHIIWGIKESLYKLDGGKFWSFLKHYRTEKFTLKDKYINCWITKEKVSDKYYAFWRMLDNYYFVIVLDYDN